MPPSPDITLAHLRKGPEASEAQVKTLFAMIQDMVETNEGACYTNEMYRKAEENLVRKEQELKMEAEKKREEEERRLLKEQLEKNAKETEELIRRYEERQKEMETKLQEELRKIRNPPVEPTNTRAILRGIGDIARTTLPGLIPAVTKGCTIL